MSSMKLELRTLIFVAKSPICTEDAIMRLLVYA